MTTAMPPQQPLDPKQEAELKKTLDQLKIKLDKFKKKLLEINNIKIACEPQMNILCFRYEVRNKNANENDLLNLNLQKFLFKKHNIFFSVVKYNNLRWLRAILLNPFFNLRHIKKICLKVSEFTKDDKILKSIRSND